MTVIINGDTGITSPADSLSGNLTFTGTGNRITGDFSNATVANRVMFQSSTTNGNSSVAVLPNGTSLVSGLLAFNNSDPTNAAFVQMATTAGTEARFLSGITGTGTYLPMTFYTGGSERMRIDTSGNVGIGTNLPLSVAGYTTVNAYNATNGALFRALSPDGTADVRIQAMNGLTFLGSFSNVPALFLTNSTERMRIDTSGNVLVTNAAGLGYGTGSGGTVTQATNKATAVTLNKPTGQITMNNAALAAGASVTFYFNNTLIGNSDVVIANVWSIPNNYSLQVLTSYAGVAQFRLTNITAGSLSEAVVINFAIIKGATA